MRVPEEPVCIYLFRKNPVFTYLHLKSPLHVVPALSGTYFRETFAKKIKFSCKSAIISWHLNMFTKMVSLFYLLLTSLAFFVMSTFVNFRENLRHFRIVLQTLFAKCKTNIFASTRQWGGGRHSIYQLRWRRFRNQEDDSKNEGASFNIIFPVRDGYLFLYIYNFLWATSINLEQRVSALYSTIAFYTPPPPSPPPFRIDQQF